MCVAPYFNMTFGGIASVRFSINEVAPVVYVVCRLGHFFTVEATFRGHVSVGVWCMYVWCRLSGGGMFLIAVHFSRSLFSRSLFQGRGYFSRSRNVGVWCMYVCMYGVASVVVVL